ncbi:MAG: pyroglutamyl-peptidase I [Bacteriovoracaceae bacterium]|jgi:pyroglutamyl-peptidase|nr:pyroglutamyl-peptidase I [Bacteriovoracaceae bacterium]
MTKKILITGFPTFHTHKSNPTESVFEYINFDPKIFNLEKLILPVSFENGFSLLKTKLSHDPPDVLIMLGLAASRSEISLERVAINLLHCDRKDNIGKVIQNTKIRVDGKAAFFSTLPLEKIAHKLTSKNIPFHFSNTAGTYICNMIFYQALEFIEQSKLNTLAGFIHVPPTKELLPTARLSIKELGHELSILIQPLT